MREQARAPPPGARRGTVALPTIAIIGAGASGTALAVQLLRRTRLDVVLAERAAFGPGLAYGTTCDAHLLNVRSERMSLFADAPSDFVDWLAVNSPTEAAPDDFARRSTYGAYLASRLAEVEAASPGRLTRVEGKAAALEGRAVQLANGRDLRFDATVLATGNLPPEPMSFPGAETLGAALIADPWAPGVLDRVGADDAVLMIGSGLTAIDVALALEVGGWRGRGLMLSRRGLLPRSHDRDAAHAAPERPIAGEPVSRALRRFRRAAERRGWGKEMDAVRPYVADLWRAASTDQRRRFLRHLRPWWDVHRHRTAWHVGEAIRRMIEAGRLEVAGGRLLGAEQEGARVRVDYRPRGSPASQAKTFDHLIVCTGPAFDLRRTSDPLLGALFRDGVVRADPLRLGLDTDEDCRIIGADGRSNERLFAIGPLTRGAFWEIVAMPDIREQAQVLAEALGRQFGDAAA